MKTLFIAKFFPPVKGGSTRWYEEIYHRYPRDSVFVLTQKTPTWEAYDAKSCLKTFRMEFWDNIGLHPKYFRTYIAILWRALRLALQNKVSIIHCDTVLPAGLIGFFVSRILRIPYVVYAHGEEIQLYRQLFPEKHAISFIYQHANRIIANSSFTLEHLLQLGVKSNKVHLIYPGVDTKVFRPGLPVDDWQHKLNLKGKRVLLTVSRLSERKGHDQVIRTLPKLLPKIPNLVYLIAGTGAEEDRLKQISASLGVDNAIRFLGYVEDDRLPSLYNLADIFIMPNREIASGDIEGFGMVFIEANACGKPVIAGRSGGTESSVIDKKTGLLVDGTKLDEISEAVLRLLEDRELSRKLGENGRERAVREFDWEMCLGKIQAIGNKL